MSTTGKSKPALLSMADSRLLLERIRMGDAAMTQLIALESQPSPAGSAFRGPVRHHHRQTEDHSSSPIKGVLFIGADLSELPQVQCDQ